MNNDETLIGEICHICAERPHGKRYDPDQTPEERSSYANLILLCPTHHTIIDKDEARYTAEALRQMKRRHTGTTDGQFKISDGLAAKIGLVLAGVGAERLGRGAIATLQDLVEAIGSTSRSETALVPSMNSKIAEALRFGPKGTVYWFRFTESGTQILDFLLEMFERAGWRHVRLADRPKLPGASADALLMLAMRDRYQISTARQTLSRVLQIAGFTQVSDDRHAAHQQDGTTFRIALAFGTSRSG